MQFDFLSRGALSAMLVSCVVLSGCASSSSSTAGESMAAMKANDDSLGDAINDDPIDTERVTLVVYGMSCPLCATNVDKQLLAVNGVSDVNVDLSSGKIDVALAAKPRPTTRQLAGAIERSGFTLMDIKKN